MTTNAAAAIVLLLAIGQWYRRVPDSALMDDRGLLRLQRFESDGSFYEDHVRIKRWKDHLPETGGWYGGRTKSELPSRSGAGLVVFVIECRRGERTHWAYVASCPLFLLFNDRPTGILLSSLGATANAPFIMVLRYNRWRVISVLERRGITTHSGYVTPRNAA